MSSNVIPIYAQGIFTVSKSGYINQIIVFDYYDPGGYYRKVVSDGTLYNEEMNKLALNMQSFLNEEEVLVNNVRVRPKVRSVSLGFRGSYRYPYVLFVIGFKIPLRKGENTYVNKYEAEVAEYNYEVLWVFEEGMRVTYVNVGFEYDLMGDRILMFSVSKGMNTPGYEEIRFILM